MHIGFRWESLASKHCAILCEEREVSAISKSAAAFPRLCDERGLSNAKPFAVVIRVALHKA
jgi:hypothetical protein